MEININEIQDLLALRIRNEIQNDRMFEIYNSLNDKELTSCYCGGKVGRVKRFLLQLVNDTLNQEGSK